MLWVLVYDMYPEWRNRVHVIVGYVCLSCFQDHESCAWGVLIPSKSTEMNFITFLAERFSPFLLYL